jgi:hypothetical protein|tara:strand:- start:788 stop:1321 length:534 start_codon:yes stop_codon:yes gene_type:complete
MACDLTIGRKEVCKDSVGGIKAIYFSNFEDTTSASYTFDATNTDVIDAVSGTPNAFKYEVRDASSFTQNIQSSADTGTTAFEQVVELTLKKLTIADHKELKLISYGRPRVIVQDQNDNYFLAGFENGCQVTAGTIVTGQAMNDLSGYTLTLTGMEKKPANFLDSDPATVGFTVVVQA